MKVKTIKRFKDLKEDTMRELGDEFDASKERVDELGRTRFGKLVEPVKPKKSAKKPETPEDEVPEPETPEDAE